MSFTARASVPVTLVTILAGVLAACDMNRALMAQQDAAVGLLRVPTGGIQPMAEVDEAGTTHLVYFSGDASAGDVFYVTQRAGGSAFSRPIRVNSQRGSAIATGTVRGAHMALGRNNRIHVAWMGSASATPRGPGNTSPMLYARSLESGDGFEQQRNVVQDAYGLDGGGTIAADDRGHVYIVWHAGEGPLEERRRVWLAESTDDGATFGRETAVTETSAGVCSCCGMKAMVEPQGTLRVLYRAFSPPDQRDMYLLTRRASDSGFTRHLLEKWSLGACPMSTTSARTTADGSVVAWETAGQVSWARVDRASSAVSVPVSPPGPGRTRKHPAIAVLGGDVLLAWTEGMAWGREGTLHWQGFDREGTPTPVSGTASGVPAWSRPAVIAREQEGFTILY